MFNKSSKNSPFKPDSTNYFLPWMVMIMVFLSTLCTSLAISLDKALNKWENTITGSITIQILPSEEEINNKKLFMKNVDDLVTALLGTPGIETAKKLDKNEVNQLLEPWFGTNELINDLPMPQIIDATLSNDITIDLDILKSIVAYQSENATIDIHQAWLNRLIDLISSVKFLTFVILVIILSTTVILVIYATTTNVSLHKKVIDLLHLIGAKDYYIASQISLKALFLSLQGAVIGFILVIPVIYIIGHYVESFDPALRETISIYPEDWIKLFSCILLAGLASGISAYITVIRKLKQML